MAPPLTRVAEGVYKTPAGAFYITYRAKDEHGRSKAVQRKARARTLTEAKKERKALASDSDRGRGPVETNLTVADIAADYFAALEDKVNRGAKSGNTLKHYQWAWNNHLNDRIGSRKLRTLTVADVERLIATLRKTGLGEHSIAQVVGALGNILNYARKRNLILANPVSDLDRDDRPAATPDKQKPATNDEQTTAIITTAKGVWSLVFRLIAFAGLRPSECLGLRWQDVVGDEIHVRGQLDRAGTWTARLKSKHSRRTVPIDAALAKTLKAHKLACHNVGDDDLVFAYEDRRPRKLSRLDAKFRSVANKIGLDDTYTAHALRKWYCSSLLDAGIPPATVAEQAGHTVAQLLATYTFDPARSRNEAKARDVMGERAAVL